jgi:integrase
MAVNKTAKGYCIRYYDADGRERKRTVKGVARDEPVRIERELLAQRDRGERPLDERRAPTFETFSKQWVEECRSGWKASTLSQYETVLKNQLRPAFNDVRVSGITEARVRQLVMRLQDAGMSARRINLVVLVLKMILRTARRRRLLRDDALAAVKMLREPRTEIDPFSPEDVDAFLAASPTWWRPYFAVAFWTGARPNEMAALKWGDVDWQGGRFRIRAGRYRGVESAPKTAGSVRDVDMLPPVVEAQGAAGRPAP